MKKRHKHHKKGISLKELKYRKKYKVEKDFYKVEHKNKRDKKNNFKAEMIKDYGNYILMRKLKNGFMYCIAKGTLICGDQKLVKLV